MRLSGRSIAACYAGSAMGDPTEVPLAIPIALFAVPFVLAIAFGALAFRGMTRLVYRCRRCGRDFTRPSHHRFPTACTRCHARDWNA